MDTGKIKYSIDKIFLLGVFALGLLISHFIILYRSRIALSEPIKLEFAGLSVSIPTGDSWNGPGKWRYDPIGNFFGLTAHLKVANRSAGAIQWRYMIAQEHFTAGHQLTNQIQETGADIVQTGRIDAKQITLEWAQLELPGMIDVFFGIVQLDEARTLEIEVRAPADPKLAERIFMAIAKTPEYMPNDLLEKGASFISRLKSIGAETVIKTNSARKVEKIFRITNTAATMSGFALNILQTPFEPADWVDLKVEGFHYADYKIDWVSENFIFRSDRRFDRYIWQTKHNSSDRQNTGSTEIEQTSNGKLQVSNIDSGTEKIYWPSAAAVSNVILGDALKIFLDYHEEKIIIDIISSTGTIVPNGIMGRLFKVSYGFDVNF